MPFTVIYDAEVLHRAPVRDLLIRLAGRPRLNLRARWTDRILDEMVDSITRRRPELADRIGRTRYLMVNAVPDCLVTGWELLVPGRELPDPDDRHVLAAAIMSSAELIVTYNVADFPAQALSPYIDVHKRSHTAVVLDDNNEIHDQLKMAADRRQSDRLLVWADRWPDRIFAVENVRGLGRLLGQQLVAAGETVVDVPAR